MKKNRILNTLLLASMLSFLLAGCADSNDTYTQADAQASIFTEKKQEEVLTSETVTGEETDATAECPEGYVYDYQVSMEPIPEDIAALGGTRQGTIHAFPSKIGMALTELEMEKNPVLKAEVEKRIPEIEAALEEEIGGEFVVDGVILENALGWIFFCTEVETGYQFELFYSNFEYHAQVNNITPLNNDIFLEDYYNEKESSSIREDVLTILTSVYSEGDFRVQPQSSVGVVDIFIAQYTDVVDKGSEQTKLLQLWEQLKAYDDTIDYNVSLTFYSQEYSSMIKEKYTSKYCYDLEGTFSEQIVLKLIDNGEIWSSLEYCEFGSKEDEDNLDLQLKKYQSGEYVEDVIWKYWIQ